MFQRLFFLCFFAFWDVLHCTVDCFVDAKSNRTVWRVLFGTVKQMETKPMVLIVSICILLEKTVLTAG